MCNNNKSKSKYITNRQYHEILQDFNAINGILSPIYADRVITNPFNVERGDYHSGMVNNVVNMIEGAPSTANKVIGYFAAVRNDQTNDSCKFNMSMSFCAPDDYEVFNTRYARYLAMCKCLSNKGLMIHVDKPKRVIGSHYPAYYFCLNNTICHQYVAFNSRCVNYYL